MSKGFFINFEGIDGTGKTTQLNLLADKLKAAGHEILMTKLPGDTVTIGGKEVQLGSNIGHQVRQMLFFKPNSHNLAPGVADMLLLADFIQATEEVIKPALAAGKVVLCDRYADSQFAYSIQKTTPAWANDMFYERYTTIPNLTILLTGDAHFLSSRTKSRTGTEAGKQDGKAWNGPDMQSRIDAAYKLQLGPLKRTVIVHVGENDSVEYIHDRIWGAVAYKLRDPELTSSDRPLYYETLAVARR
jgi:dTMP kinase